MHFPDPEHASFEDVHAITDHRWKETLGACGINTELLTARHGPCPGCGGTDRFRFDDLDGKGTWFCSQGGGTPAAGDGFALIVHCGLADDNAGALKLVTGILNASSGRPDRSGERSGPNGGNPSPKITKHVYRFPEGKKHLIVHRTDREDGSKTFWQEFKPGVWKKPPGYLYIPYRLQAWAEATPPVIYITEGEQCANALGNPTHSYI